MHQTFDALLAAFYDEALAGAGLILPAPLPDACDARHAWHLYVVRCAGRDELRSRLRTEGIECLVHYPVPIHRQPAYQGRLPGADNLPETERAATEVLSLPLYPQLTRAEAQHVVTAVRAWSLSPASVG